MTRITTTRRIRNVYAKDGERLPPLPKEMKVCSVCRKTMQVADGSVAYYHACCRKFRNSKLGAIEHTEECHA